jgi:cell division protein FtsB
MLEFQEKRLVKRLLYSKLTIFILLILVVFLTNAVWKVYRKQIVANDNLVKTAASLESLRTRETILISEIEKLKTKEGVEDEIREKFSLIKPGEEMIVIINDDEDQTDRTIFSGDSLWQKIINFFKFSAQNK